MAQRWLWLALIGSAFVSAVRAEETAAPQAELAIGVAPFERVAPVHAEVPDVAMLLADRLASKGIGRVLGPATWKQAPAPNADAGEIAKAAKEASLDAVVVGSTTLVGSKISIDVRVRDGVSGQTAGTFIEEIAQASALGSAIDRLADGVLSGAQRAAAGLPRSTEPAARAVSTAAAPAEKATGARSSWPADDTRESRKGKTAGSNLFSREGGPLKITSDELEAIQSGGSRTFVFERNVHVTQGALTLQSDRLEVFYPTASGQPEKLMATGHVLLRQQGKEVRCERATYLRAQERIYCRGNASMQQDQDVVYGDEIEYELETERLFVRGGARVRIAADKDAAKPSGGKDSP